MSIESLIERVRLALNPKVQDWVLFSNGTVIVFDNTKPDDNIEQEAINLMREFGPVHVAGSAGDSKVVPLTETE